MDYGSPNGNNAGFDLWEPDSVVVPHFALADPSVEPSDEALEALCAAAIQDVVERHRVANAQFDDRMKSALAEAIRAGEKDRPIIKQ